MPAFALAMVLYADLGFNARSDLYSTVAGIATLSGAAARPGRPGRHGDDHRHRRTRQRRAVTAAIAHRQAHGHGFGHRVYEPRDCRVAPPRASSSGVAALRDGSDLLATDQLPVSAMLWAKARDPNLDVSGPLSRLIGLHRDFFTPLFTMSGVGGWTAHIVEQRTSNTLFGRWPPTPTRRAPTYRPAVGP